MKFFKNRFTNAFIAAVIAVLLVFTTAQPRKAEAFTSAIIVAAIQMATSLVTDQIMASISDMAGGIGDIISDRLMPFQENLWAQFERERILADVEKTKQLAAIEEASIQQEYINNRQDQVVEDTMEHYTSKGECAIKTFGALTSGAQTESQLVQTKRELQELVRRESNFVMNSPGAGAGSGGNSLYVNGPVAASNALFEFRMQETCSKDEHRGNMEAVCQNTNAQAVNKDLCAGDLVKGITFPKEDKKYIVQCLRYLVPPPAEIPANKNVSDDPAMKNYVLRLKQREAQYKAQVDFIIDKVAVRMEPEDCPKVNGGSADRKTWVNAVDELVGVTADPTRPCPSLAEMNKYFQIAITNPAVLETLCNEGPDQNNSCEHLINRKIAEQEYEMTNLLTFSNLIEASSNIEEREAIAPPPTY
tara:strand:- start:804 stop:2057 length:1254 start_codon:yes stop_codon:yes gene_type:complete